MLTETKISNQESETFVLVLNLFNFAEKENLSYEDLELIKKLLENYQFEKFQIIALKREMKKYPSGQVILNLITNH